YFICVVSGSCFVVYLSRVFSANGNPHYRNRLFVLYLLEANSFHVGDLPFFGDCSRVFWAIYSSFIEKCANGTCQSKCCGGRNFSERQHGEGLHERTLGDKSLQELFRPCGSAHVRSRYLSRTFCVFFNPGNVRRHCVYCVVRC